MCLVGFLNHLAHDILSQKCQVIICSIEGVILIFIILIFFIDNLFQILIDVSQTVLYCAVLCFNVM